MREVVFPLSTLICVVLQGATLDYYLFIHRAFCTWEDLVPWIVGDIAVVCVLTSVFWYSRKYTLREAGLRSARVSSDVLSSYGQHGNGHEYKGIQRSESHKEIAALPVMYIGWLVYSGLLVAKIVAIFKTFGPSLDGKTFWGTNELEFLITGTAGIFAFFVASKK